MQETLSLSEKLPVLGFSPVLETLSLSEKIPLPRFFLVLTGDFEFEQKNPCSGIFHGTGALQR